MPNYQRGLPIIREYVYSCVKTNKKGGEWGGGALIQNWGNLAKYDINEIEKLYICELC